MLDVKTILKITNGTLYSGDKSLICTSFNKDTRTIKSGDTYIGIKGDNFDGNEFYKEAFSKGANVCILDEASKSFLKKNENTIILVKDTIKALQDMAKYYLEEKKPKVIALTGSVGKTSTKDMIYSVLKNEYSVLKTEGNYNNHIGLPLTILKLQDEEILLLEMGMNSLGEISLLSNLVKPDIAIITNIYSVHIGKLGSMENILKAKLEILDGLKENGFLILNNDNKYLREFNKNNITIKTYGINYDSDVKCENIHYEENRASFDIDNITININIPTEAFISNALVAYSVGKLLYIDKAKIKQGLENFELSEKRLEVISIKGIKIINDSYNAGSESIKNGIDYLLNIKANRHIAILGDILETGDYSREIHEDVGKYIIEKNMDVLIAIGNDALYIYNEVNGKIANSYYFSSKEESYKFLVEFLKKEDVILIKASNGMKFWEITEFLKTTDMW